MFNRLIFNSGVLDFLQKTSGSQISLILIHGTGSEMKDSLICEEGNFIDIDPNECDVLSYLPKSKYLKVGNSNQFSSPGRVRIKVGRFVKKFLTKHSMEKYQ